MEEKKQTYQKLLAQSETAFGQLDSILRNNTRCISNILEKAQEIENNCLTSQNQMEIIQEALDKNAGINNELADLIKQLRANIDLGGLKSNPRSDALMSVYGEYTSHYPSQSMMRAGSNEIEPGANTLSLSEYIDVLERAVKFREDLLKKKPQGSKKLNQNIERASKMLRFDYRNAVSGEIVSTGGNNSRELNITQLKLFHRGFEILGHTEYKNMYIEVTLEKLHEKIDSHGIDGSGLEIFRKILKFELNELRALFPSNSIFEMSETLAIEFNAKTIQPKLHSLAKQWSPYDKSTCSDILKTVREFHGQVYKLAQES
jgi:hypothetical protein